MVGHSPKEHHERTPKMLCCLRCREEPEQLKIRRGPKHRERFPRQLRANARNELQYTKRRHFVELVFCPPQDGKDVLHVRAVEEFAASELHKRNAVPHEFDFQPGAVVRRAEQDSLSPKVNSVFEIAHDSVDDEIGLFLVRLDRDQGGPISISSIGAQSFLKSARREVQHGIARVENRLRGTVILLEGYDLGGRFEECFVGLANYWLLFRSVDDEFFLVVALTPTGNLGKARYLMRRHLEALRADL